VENANDIIYRTDMSGNFTYVNPSALKMMGYTSEQEMLGKNYLDLTMPEFRHKISGFMTINTSATKSIYYEFPQLPWTAHCMGWAKRTAHHGWRTDHWFQAVARSITQLKQAQEALPFRD
jgi:PAS domain S-box-containing protein